MEIFSSQEIGFPVEQVYALVRDNLPDIVPYLQNVKRIDIESREDLGQGRIRLVNRWHGKGEIPKVVQSVVKPEMLTWLDTALWDDAEKTCRWEIQTMFFRENVKCSGVNYYKQKNKDQTIMEITGDLSIRLKGIPGIPRLLEKTIASQVERFIVRLLTPNMSSLAQGVNQYLSAKKV